jgi:hypothetical protein
MTITVMERKGRRIPLQKCLKSISVARDAQKECYDELMSFDINLNKLTINEIKFHKNINNIKSHIKNDRMQILSKEMPS